MRRLGSSGRHRHETSRRHNLAVDIIERSVFLDAEKMHARSSEFGGNADEQSGLKVPVVRLRRVYRTAKQDGRLYLRCRGYRGGRPRNDGEGVGLMSMRVI